MDAHGWTVRAGWCLFVALASAQVAVCQPCPAGTRLRSFTATPSTITNGDSFTLRWRAPCGSVSLWRAPSGFRIPAHIECVTPTSPFNVHPPALFDTHPPLIHPPTPFAKDLAPSSSYELRPGLRGYPVNDGRTVYAAVLWSGAAAHPTYCVRFTTVTMNAAPCTSDNACDDHNPCTSDTCVNGQCQHTSLSDGTACPDDGNPCTTDTCVSGACQHTNVASGTDCGGSGHCRVCNNSGVCYNKTPGTWCAGTCGVCESSGLCSGDGGSSQGDVNRCPGDTRCQTCDGRDCHSKSAGDKCDGDCRACDNSGSCNTDSAILCNDGNVCTIDSCSNGICQNDPMVPCG